MGRRRARYDLGKMRGLGSLGASAGEPAAWYDALGKLQEWNVALKNAEDAFRKVLLKKQAAGEPVNTAEMQQDSRALLDNRNSYTRWSQDFTLAYRIAFGSVPGGLSGMGAFQAAAALFYGTLLVAIIAAAAIGYPAAMGLWNKYSAILQGQQNAGTIANGVVTAQQQAATLQQQATAADAAGDHDKADALRASAQLWLNQANALAKQVRDMSPDAGGDWSAWLQENSGIIGIGLAATFVAMMLVKKL